MIASTSQQDNLEASTTKWGRRCFRLRRRYLVVARAVCPQISPSGGRLPLSSSKVDFLARKPAWGGQVPKHPNLEPSLQIHR